MKLKLHNRANLARNLTYTPKSRLMGPAAFSRGRDSSLTGPTLSFLLVMGSHREGRWPDQRDVSENLKIGTYRCQGKR